MLCNFEKIEERSFSRKLRVVILGSTGSIGLSALELCRRYPDYLEPIVITAGVNAPALAAQAKEFLPRYAVLADGDIDRDLFPPETELLAGKKALCEAAALPEADVVLASILGIACLEPVLSALKAGKKVALANKESVVCGGAFLEDALAFGGSIVPVDSEHSSLFQCLLGRSRTEVRNLVLTASGGPFLNTGEEDLRRVTPQDAVNHPKWRMGAKISVDSATMMNKALEVIEARWLFGFENIDVVVHPESIIHSFIGLRDGSMMCHMSAPDMKAPIAFGLLHPEVRLPGVLEPLSLPAVKKLEFIELDHERFPAVKLAMQCLSEGGAAPAVFNIADEIAVQAFLGGRIAFSDIMRVNTAFLSTFTGTTCRSVEELRILHEEMMRKSEAIIGGIIAAG